MAGITNVLGSAALSTALAAVLRLIRLSVKFSRVSNAILSIRMKVRILPRSVASGPIVTLLIGTVKSKLAPSPARIKSHSTQNGYYVRRG